MRPSDLKRAAPFLLKFALSLALLLALWPPFSWVYGPLLGAAASALFALVRPVVSVEVGERVYFVYHLWPEALRCEVRDFGAVCLNALVVTAAFAALPGGLRGRLKALGAALLTLFVSHLLCLYLLSYVTIWNSLSGAAPSPRLLSRANAAAPHHMALVCGKVYALWGAFGWEGLPFLAGALAFLKGRGLLRAKGRSPSARPRPRRTPSPPARAQRGWRSPARPLERRAHLPLRGEL
jgi:hypothetical protein